MNSLELQKTALIEQLDAAVQLREVHVIVKQVQQVLTGVIQCGGLQLSDRFRVPSKEFYARRLFHRDLDRGYTAVVMTWGPGQGTSLHDHAGMWCVEGVVEGEMKVSRYELVGQAGDLYQFKSVGTLHANVGSSGNLIPPFEYHILTNALDKEVSITFHVYGGEMTHCSIYEPRGRGWYRREEKALSYIE